MAALGSARVPAPRARPRTPLLSRMPRRLSGVKEIKYQRAGVPAFSRDVELRYCTAVEAYERARAPLTRYARLFPRRAAAAADGA